MEKRKKKICLNGRLVGSLVKGKDAFISSGGKLYHTSPVVRIFEQTDMVVSFETVNIRYKLTADLFPTSPVSQMPLKVAA